MFFSRQDQTKMLEAINKHVEETNAAFEAADKPTRRVMLARDILLQLVSHRILPTSCYFGPIQDYFWINGTEIRDRLKITAQCNVCGIGALFMAAVQRLDQIQCDDFLEDERYSMIGYMEKFDLFSFAELDAIEDFFERRRAYGEHPLRTEAWALVGSNDRLRRIAATIIKTEGRKAITLDLLLLELPTDELDPPPVVHMENLDVDVKESIELQ